MSPTAEEVLKARQEEQARQAEQWAREAKAKQAEEDRAYDARRVVLLTELAAEARLAIQRLEAKGFPGGTIEVVVTGYEPRKTWWGRRYHAQRQDELACWQLGTSRDLHGYLLTSEARVVARTYSNHVDRHGYPLVGLNDVTASDEVLNYGIKRLIEGLKQIAV